MCAIEHEEQLNPTLIALKNERDSRMSSGAAQEKTVEQEKRSERERKAKHLEMEILIYSP